MRLFRQILRLTRRALGWAVGFLAAALLLGGSTFPLHVPWHAVSSLVAEHHFDYIAWEVQAIAAKSAQAMWGMAAYMDEAERADYVRAYFADLRRAREIEGEIRQVYTDPAVPDAAAATIELRAERDSLRADLAARQSLAEAILESQVAAVITESGFGLGGQLLPPLSMRFSEAPNLLVVSPRDAIRQEITLLLDPLTVDAMTTLESTIDEAQDVASLILPIGGMALYPAMIVESDNLPWVAETFAHEWLHHYLLFFPLGFLYQSGGETRLINETVADAFGKAIGAEVMARYYPEYAAAPASDRLAARDAQTEDPPAFDFGAAMHETRTRVDALLAEGRVEEAEDYMAERQALFYENGYHIRKLNQAFFAFYGGYQAGGGVVGAAGADPIGPAVREILALSDGLHDFILNVRGITTRPQLLALRNAIRHEMLTQSG